ncbi:acyl carrier protein [Lentzea sp. DG1S-22]|uniref:acyl carrier protein n=1 Tax=Lentzea sp. DG1S-22 TaxID=3108822 RepID=UPI002E7A0B0B|nr:acyl carrier protein [Lentzea sp. DG1S-22]WVH82074.1 acyl carrier protein [Lentzea sp. DG1S-22]
MTALISLVADVLRVPSTEVDWDTGTSTSAAWTSLRHVELVMRVEREYGIKLTAREARTCRSVRRLHDVLVEKGVQV